MAPYVCAHDPKQTWKLERKFGVHPQGLACQALAHVPIGDVRVARDWRRPSNQIALYFMAALVEQEQAFLLGLDSFRDSRNVQSLGQTHHRAHDRLAMDVCINTRDEGLIDLEFV